MSNADEVAKLKAAVDLAGKVMPVTFCDTSFSLVLTGHETVAMAAGPLTEKVLQDTFGEYCAEIPTCNADEVHLLAHADHGSGEITMKAAMTLANAAQHILNNYAWEQAWIEFAENNNYVSVKLWRIDSY
jgi:hypothetical protein